MVETIDCVVPRQPPGTEDDLPHPDIKSTYISPSGPDFLINMWIYNSNPFHAAQSTQDLPTSGLRVINRGRKIATRGEVSVSFESHEQVLADKMTVCTASGANLDGVRVACNKDGGMKREQGFIDIYSSETLTIGWNCLLDHAQLKFPQIALGIAESRTEDDRDIRERRVLLNHDAEQLWGGHGRVDHK